MGGLLFFWLSPKLTNFVTALEFQAVESQLKTNQQHLAIQCGLKTRHDMSGAYKDLKDYNGLVGAHEPKNHPVIPVEGPVFSSTLPLNSIWSHVCTEVGL